MHIQQMRLETDGENFQDEEKLEEARDMPTRDMSVATLLDEEDEQQVSQENTAEKTTTEWTLSATEDEEEDSMGVHGDFPIYRNKLQQRRLHEQSQPGQQLDEVIKHLRKLMLKSAQETSINEKLIRRETTAVAVERWTRKIAPKSFFRSRRIQYPRWRAHEQELVNFSQQRSMMQEHLSQASHVPASQSTQCIFNDKERHQSSHILNLNQKHLMFVGLLETKDHAYT